MPHQACRSLCWSQRRQVVVLLPTLTTVLSLPLIEQWIGKLEMGLTRGLSLQVPRGEPSCSQLPLTCLWHFAEKGEEISGLRCLDACPHFTPCKLTQTPTSPNLPQSQGRLRSGLMENNLALFTPETACGLQNHCYQCSQPISANKSEFSMAQILSLAEAWKVLLNMAGTNISIKCRGSLWSLKQAGVFLLWFQLSQMVQEHTYIMLCSSSAAGKVTFCLFVLLLLFRVNTNAF